MNLLALLAGGALMVLIGMILLMRYEPSVFVSEEVWERKTVPIKQKDDLVKDGIHVATGLVAEEGYKVVVANCTNCHAADLIIQNRGTKDSWTELIDWMQETQGLWDLGDNEQVIVSYLSKYYAPVQEGRRANLSDIEWYELED